MAFFLGLVALLSGFASSYFLWPSDTEAETKMQHGVTNLYFLHESDRKIPEPGAGQKAVCRAFPYPVFNPYPVNYFDEHTPVCTDFPVIDVALDLPNPSFSQSQDEHFSPHRFAFGDNIVALLYINNGGIDQNEFIAKNVRITTSIKSDGKNHRISATFSGDNVAALNRSLTIETGDDEYLEVYPNSGFMFTYEGKLMLERQGFNLGNATFELGDLTPGFQYALFLSFKMRVKRRA